MKIKDGTLQKYANTIQNTFLKYFKRFSKQGGNPRDLIWIDNEEEIIIVMALHSEREKLKEYIKERRKELRD